MGLSGPLSLSGTLLPSGTSVDTRLEIKEVCPIQYHGRVMQILTYKRIAVEKLSKEWLERLYELAHSKEKIAIMETPGYFFIQYPKKPIILIGRQSGRLYWIGDCQREYAEHQSTFVIRILNDYGLVEGLTWSKAVRK